MKKPHAATIVLTIINLVVMAVSVSGLFPVAAEAQADVLRGRRLELVDEAGKTRVEIKVAPGGEAVFRIRDESGDIRVKIGGDDCRDTSSSLLETGQRPTKG